LTPIEINAIKGECNSLASSIMAGLPQITAFVSWPSAPLTDSLVRNALSKMEPPPKTVTALPEDKEDLDSRNVLQWASYDEIHHEFTIFPPPSTTLMSCAYTIRKALIRKHFLSRSAHRHVVKNPSSPLKAGIPRTWELELRFLDELDEMWTDELWDLGDELDKGDKWMILKPGMADRGMGVRLFHTKEELESIFEEFEDEESDDDDGGQQMRRRDDEEDEEPGTRIATSQLRHFVIQVRRTNELRSC
jgi:tubulin---tyrosine ligase